MVSKNGKSKKLFKFNYIPALKFFISTFKVVYIFEKKNRRLAVGHFISFTENLKKTIIFEPLNLCLPQIEIPVNSCPSDIISGFLRASDTLCLVKIVDTPIDSKFALVEFECVIGRKGDITAETDAILLENGVDTKELNEDLTEDFI